MKTKHNKDHKTKIIAIEGLDKAGKHTATNTLRNYFLAKGLTVELMSFPNYESPVGQLLREWLTGKLDADHYTFELLQAADKQAGQTKIAEYEARGVDVIIIDRYVHTELAYGAYDNDETWLSELTKYMRKPDFVLYMNVEPEVSMHRKGKFGDNDRYESDIERLRYTKHEYECLFQEESHSDVHTIDANQPQLIVKSNVLKSAAKMYEDITGESVASDDHTKFVTKEQLAMIHEFERTVTSVKN